MYLICYDCGLIGVFNNTKNIYECKKCNNYKNFKKINIPYIVNYYFKLESMSIIIDY